MKCSKHEPDSLLCGDITDAQLSALKHTKMDFIHTRAEAADEKHALGTPQIIRPQHICTNQKDTKLEAFFVRTGGQNKGLGLKLHPINIYPVI